MEDDMGVVAIVLNEDIQRRAKEAVHQMREDGEHTIPFAFFHDEAEEQGLLSDSSANMIPIGSLEIEGTTYFIGLPTK